MSYNKMSVVMDQFDLFGIPKIFKKSILIKMRQLSTESFTRCNYMNDNHVEIRKY